MLGDKLNRLSGQIVGKAPTPSISTENRRFRQAAAYLGGEPVSSSGGAYIKIVSDFPLLYSHGDYSLSDIFDHYPNFRGAGLLGSRESVIDQSKLLFFDMETTGLSGGSGTVAFLIGFGSFSNDGFQVRQYLLPDYPDEAAMLEAVRDEIKEDSILTTYNGRAFDLPILTDRLILHRIERNLTFAGHLDLLHPVRRLYRRRLRDCSLGNIEREILRYYRFDDIPGYLVPAVYFNWLATGEMSELRRVNRHNVDDIVSMLFIMHHFAQLEEAPSRQVTSPDDIYSLCRIMEYAGNTEGLFGLIDESQEMIWQERRFDILFSHSLSYKRGNQPDKAINLWEKIAQAEAPESYSARIELAKYYEHRLKDFSGALKYSLEAKNGCPDRPIFIEELEKRINRLHRKLSR